MHIMTLCLMLQGVPLQAEEGLECLNRMLQTQPQFFVIMYQTNGKASLISTLR